MDPTRARAILKSLADGLDPATGAPFPPDSPYQQADTIHTLYMILDKLTEQPRTMERIHIDTAMEET